MTVQLLSRTYEADSISAVQELYHSNGWTDGLPIVPPTADAVQACLDWVMMPPDQLIGIEPVRGLAITAEKLLRPASWRDVILGGDDLPPPTALEPGVREAIATVEFTGSATTADDQPSRHDGGHGAVAMYEHRIVARGHDGIGARGDAIQNRRTIHHVIVLGIDKAVGQETLERNAIALHECARPVVLESQQRALVGILHVDGE